MKNMTLAHITEVCGGTYFGPEEKKTAEVTDIVTDSRKAGEGSLFVAIPGERVDGHKFIPNVASQGALAVISEQTLETPPCPYILVKDSMEAIKAMAEYYMQQLNIPVVGITGSVGKTSTKETIASVLAQKYRVLKTDANFNNELGLSLTVFRLREEDEMAVLEMGIDDFGQMHRLAKIARPETAVITNIGWCHLENLKTRDGILQAKTEIFDHLRENGHIIINGDDDKLSTVGTVHGIKPVHFGLDEKNEYYADEIESQGFRGISCRIHTPQGSFSALIPIPGRHMVYNALAGTAVGCMYGLTLEQIKQGIETLQEAKGRKVAVLGDMGELGTDEAALHAEVGTHAGICGIDALYCAGPLCEYLAKAAKEADPQLEIRHFADRESLIAELPKLLQDGDQILVKASHFMEYGKIVEMLETAQKL